MTERRSAVTLNGEIVVALTNWQGLTLIVTVLLADAAWRRIRRRFARLRACNKTPTL
jgi:hypothetical protein